MVVRVLVLRSEGINCNDETQRAFALAGAHAEQVHVSELIAGAKQLKDYHIFVIPGGFSYGDDLGAGRVLANELAMKLKEHMQAFVADGRLVLGICNGFQVLVKTGFLPVQGGQQVTLGQNDSAKFECRWVHIAKANDCAFTKGIKRLYLPVAHGEGKLIFRDGPDAFRRQVVFRYADADGNETSRYPDNPNGSEGNVAALCNETGTVMGMMPHPERHVRCENHPRWTREGCRGEGDGMALFRNAVRYAEERLV